MLCLSAPFTVADKGSIPTPPRHHSIYTNIDIHNPPSIQTLITVNARHYHVAYKPPSATWHVQSRERAPSDKQGLEELRAESTSCAAESLKIPLCFRLDEHMNFAFYQVPRQGPATKRNNLTSQSPLQDPAPPNMSPNPQSMPPSNNGQFSPDSQYRVVRKRNRVPLSCAPCRNRK